ncbi:MAG: MarR family winged helix-turn-helix transcriptional regulator [Candidatus Thorarchaeota archaeon]
MKIKRKAGFLISQIHQIAGRKFARKLKKHKIKINPGQGRILFALWEKDGISIRDLAKRTSLGKSTISSMLKRMRNEGYIRLEHPPDNERTKLVYVLQQSKEIESAFEKLAEEMNNIYYKGFIDEEIKEFEDNLERVLQNLKEDKD